MINIFYSDYSSFDALFQLLSEAQKVKECLAQRITSGVNDIQLLNRFHRSIRIESTSESYIQIKSKSIQINFFLEYLSYMILNLLLPKIPVHAYE